MCGVVVVLAALFERSVLEAFLLVFVYFAHAFFSSIDYFILAGALWAT